MVKVALALAALALAELKPLSERRAVRSGITAHNHRRLNTTEWSDRIGEYPEVMALV